MKSRITVLLASAIMLGAMSMPAAANDVGQVLSGGIGNLISIYEANLVEYSGVVDVSFLGMTVQSGYVVLGDAKGPPSDETLWSDIVVFTNAGHIPTNVNGDAATKIAMISDQEHTITDGEIATACAGLGLPTFTIADVKASLTAGFAVRKFESNTGVTGWRPADLSATYHLWSDPALIPAAGPTALLILFCLLAASGAYLVWRRGRTRSELA